MERWPLGPKLSIPFRTSTIQLPFPSSLVFDERWSLLTSPVSSMSTAIAQQKIRIRLKAFDRRMLDLSCEKIIETADHTAATAIGPIPLPTKRKIYCVLRSPHVDKDSREHFETRTHRRIIDIYSPSAKTVDALMKLDLPAGVDVEIKLQ